MSRIIDNRVREVAPERDTRLRLVSEACARSGMPANLCDTLAEGYVARLRRRAFEVLSDVVGNGDDVEVVCGWQGPPRVLAKALADARYIREVKGFYVAADAVTECPEYIKARWKRTNRDGYDLAVSRASEPNVIHKDSPRPGLFGPDELDAKEASKHEAKNPGHSDIVAHWHEKYLEANGIKYPFGGRDFRLIAQLIELAGDVSDLKRAMDAYLADRSNFYRGHPLYKLVQNFPRYYVPDPGGSDAVGSLAPAGAGRL